VECGEAPDLLGAGPANRRGLRCFAAVDEVETSLSCNDLLAALRPYDGITIPLREELERREGRIPPVIDVKSAVSVDYGRNPCQG
jgi:hypothetical protein